MVHIRTMQNIIQRMSGYSSESSCTTGVFNQRTAGRLRPSGEVCVAREGYFTKYNAL